MALAQANNTVIELSEAIMNIPPKPGLVSEQGLFQGRGIATSKLHVDVKDKTFRLMAETPPGSPAEHVNRDTRSTITFDVPQYLQKAPIHEEDIQDRRAFGSDSDPMPYEEERMDVLEKMSNNIDVHYEAMRVSALKGQLLNPDGSVRTNFFTEFGVSQVEVDFKLTTATTAVLEKCMDVHVAQRSGLGGGRTQAGAWGLVSIGFFNALRDHAKVRDTYLSMSEARQMREAGRRVQFEFGGIIWEPYFDTVTETDGDSRQLIEDNYGYVVPLGTDIFQERWAPVSLRGLANTRGLPRYAWEVNPEDPSEARSIGSGMRCFPYVTRPHAVIKVKKA